MKKIIKLLSVCGSILLTAFLFFVSAGAEKPLYSAEDAEFRYDEIVLGDAGEINYFIKQDSDLAQTESIAVNGSFEDGFNGWTEGANYIDGSNASDGTNSATLLQWYHLKQTVKVEKGASYAFSFDVWNTAKVWATASILAADGVTVLYKIQLDDTFGQGVWQTVSGVFEAGDNETVTIDFVADGNFIKVDNVAVKKIEYRVLPANDGRIPIVQDKDYTFTIIWERADGLADGEFTVSGRARQLGDVNGDTTADVRDLIALKKGMAKLSAEWVYDITLDNSVNSDDLVSLQRILLEN